jgi:hypothetical protein
MPSWDDAVRKFQAQPEKQRGAWLQLQFVNHLKEIARLRGGRNCILYGSGFLQKANVPASYVSVSREDINGAMSSVHGMDCSKELTLVLHSPGGDIGGAEALMAYLHTKFADVEVIVPSYAMSAGTMMALGSQRVVMGRQSQLGPIDAQLMASPGRQVSAGAVLSQFAAAEKDILANAASAALWAPILQQMGPALHQEATYALDYGQSMVKAWLEARMCKGSASPSTDADRIAQYFNTTDQHKNHGRRIDRDECRKIGVVVEDLEADQVLQEQVLTLYHYMTLFFETSPATKIWINNDGRRWIKNFQP